MMSNSIIGEKETEIARRKLRCFVAMAFGKSDTDALYDSSILPVLKSLGITPIIINRRQDNRDINIQIIEQLKMSDFAIADLTYARPSVYFEAGYVQSTNEVLYTVRSDHLSKGQPDDLRVHFDLQMKPLIVWNAPDDLEFRMKLRSRINSTIVLPWKKQQKTQLVSEGERRKFASQSVDERLSSLRRTCLKSFGNAGFTRWELVYFGLPLPGAPRTPSSDLSRIMRGFTSRSAVMAVKNVDTQLDTLIVMVVESLTKGVLKARLISRFIKSNWRPPHLQSKLNSKSIEELDSSSETYLFVSLKRVPQSRVLSALHSFGVSASGRVYSSNDVFDDWQMGTHKISIDRRIKLSILDDIQSVADLKEKLQVALSDLYASLNP